MKKMIYAALSVAVIAMAQACGNKVSNETVADSDSMNQTDTAALVDTTVKDETPADTAVKPETSAQEETAKAEDAAKNENSAQIDKKIKEFKNYVSDIRNTFYDGGQFYPSNDAEARATMINPAVKLDKELSGMQKDMSDSQKAEYNKLRKSVKEALQ